MVDHVILALAQLNPVVGDVTGNGARLLAAREQAAAQGADLVIASELFLSGYPPEDIATRPSFVAACMAEATRLAGITADGGPALLFGSPWLAEHQGFSDPEQGTRQAMPAGSLLNASILADRGEIRAVRAKYRLPNYGVFDEVRVFQCEGLPGPIEFRGIRLGVMVCEDMWDDEVTECLAETGAEILVVLNGSPFSVEKFDERFSHAVARIRLAELPLIYVNQVGGQDELVFDGRSFVINADLQVGAMLPEAEEGVVVTSWRRADTGIWRCESVPEARQEPDRLALIYRILVLGLRDYVEKNHFPGIVLGLSGGIDSAVAAVLACDAIGPDRVRCVMMPSPYTSRISLTDAEALARKLGVRYDVIEIDAGMHAVDRLLSGIEAGAAVADENIQARLRGVILMAISNRLGAMVLATGNKSEMAVGYATLYGDMCGGFAVLKDIYKTEIFALARWRNAHRFGAWQQYEGEVIPDRVITRPPSAELRHDQRDDDNLPPYPRLDEMLRFLIEQDGHCADWPGSDRDEIRRVWSMLTRAEYKRRQAPPGVKISQRTLSRERRYPITNGWTE